MRDTLRWRHATYKQTRRMTNPYTSGPQQQAERRDSAPAPAPRPEEETQTPRPSRNTTIADTTWIVDCLACVDESVLALQKTQQLGHCKHWLCFVCIQTKVGSRPEETPASSTFRGQDPAAAAYVATPCHRQSTRRKHTSTATSRRARTELVASTIKTSNRRLLAKTNDT